MTKGDVILFYPSYEEMARYHWFPFPYLYLGPFLEKAGFRVIVIDARVEPDWKKLLSKNSCGAAFLGITAMTSPDIRVAMEAVDISRASNPHIKVVWGGPHATALPAQTLESAYADIVVYGQGEYTASSLAERLSADKDYSDVPGIYYKKDGLIRASGACRKVPFDYDIFPAYHLIDIEKYRSPNNVASVFTVRGCPHGCTFCSTGDQGYSERALEQVKKELLFVVNNLKFKNIFFQDGTYFISKKRVMEIARFIIESGLEIKWKAKARANSLPKYSDAEMSILKKSGLVSVFFGIESGSERVLKNMNKRTSPLAAQKSAAICRRYEIEFYASFMFATPGETLADLKATASHIKKLKKIYAEAIIQNCIYTPLPATRMFEEARKLGYAPPSTLEGWAESKVLSSFDKRPDIAWMGQDELKEYINIYNAEFGGYKHLYEKEESGSYVSVFRKKSCAE